MADDKIKKPPSLPRGIRTIAEAAFSRGKGGQLLRASRLSWHPEGAATGIVPGDPLGSGAPFTPRGRRLASVPWSPEEGEAMTRQYGQTGLAEGDLAQPPKSSPDYERLVKSRRKYVIPPMEGMRPAKVSPKVTGKDLWKLAWRAANTGQYEGFIRTVAPNYLVLANRIRDQIQNLKLSVRGLSEYGTPARPLRQLAEAEERITARSSRLNAIRRGLKGSFRGASKAVPALALLTLPSQTKGYAREGGPSLSELFGSKKYQGMRARQSVTYGGQEM